jgi:uncharacterized protein YrrD
MLISSNELQGFKLAATDGAIGKVQEFYFDDKYWTVRYLVAETGSWLMSRKVLISPHALNKVDQDERIIQTNLSKIQIERCPAIDTDAPVSKQYEKEYSGYYNYPLYWGGDYAWGISASLSRDFQVGASQKETWDPSLRSTKAVEGYDIQASDGEIGNVKDFIIDDKTWTIRYLVVETGHWLNEKLVLVAPLWIERINWSDSKVFTSLSKDEVRTAPGYIDQTLLDRANEDTIYSASQSTHS